MIWNLAIGSLIEKDLPKSVAMDRHQIRVGVACYGQDK